jgi:hypothetical protein
MCGYFSSGKLKRQLREFGKICPEQFGGLFPEGENKAWCVIFF